MRYKKAFSLAELLIVLTVIGVIASLSLPTLINGVKEKQIRASYKKALLTISNIVESEKAFGTLPSTNQTAQIMRLFQAIHDNISPSYYVSALTSPVNNGRIISNSSYLTTFKFAGGQTYGSGTIPEGTPEENRITTASPSPWMITDDNMAYSVHCGGQTNVAAPCGTVADINSQTTLAGAATASCAMIIVDINGLSKGPNIFEPQMGVAVGDVRVNDDETALDVGVNLEALTGDQYLIFIGSDGTTAGARRTSVSGRIAADMK